MLTWMETAYVDESQVGGTGNGGSYVMVATIIIDGDVDDLRRALIRAKPKGAPKLHWYSNMAKARHASIELIATLPLMHWAVVTHPSEDEPPERTRRKCIGRLFWELASLEMVGQVLMESRGPADDRRDMRMIDTLKSARAIPGSMRVDHQPGRDEPLLWLPDAVCGAVGAHVDGDDSWVEMLDRQLWICP